MTAAATTVSNGGGHFFRPGREYVSEFHVSLQIQIHTPMEQTLERKYPVGIQTF